jgi:hypothetical protein
VRVLFEVAALTQILHNRQTIWVSIPPGRLRGHDERDVQFVTGVAKGRRNTVDGLTPVLTVLAGDLYESTKRILAPLAYICRAREDIFTGFRPEWSQMFIGRSPSANTDRLAKSNSEAFIVRTSQISVRLSANA